MKSSCSDYITNNQAQKAIDLFHEVKDSDEIIVKLKRNFSYRKMM